MLRKWKVPDYKDKRVFGVPLIVVQQRTGQPLPQCMLYAMRCLRRTARDAVGIFRKSGVRSRIQKLRNQLEAEPGQLRTHVIYLSTQAQFVMPVDSHGTMNCLLRRMIDCLTISRVFLPY